MKVNYFNMAKFSKFLWSNQLHFFLKKKKLHFLSVQNQLLYYYSVHILVTSYFIALVNTVKFMILLNVRNITYMNDFLKKKLIRIIIRVNY